MARPHTGAHLREATFYDGQGNPCPRESAVITIHRRGDSKSETWYGYFRVANETRSDYKRKTLNTIQLNEAIINARRYYGTLFQRLDAGQDLNDHKFPYVCKMWKRHFELDLQRQIQSVEGGGKPPKGYKSRKHHKTFRMNSVEAFMMSEDSPLYDKSIRHIRTSDIERWLRWRANTPNPKTRKLPSNHMLNKQIQILRQIFQFAYDREWIDTIPPMKYRPTNDGETGNEFELPEIALIKRELDNRCLEPHLTGSSRRDRELLRAWVLLLLATGARSGEPRKCLWSWYSERLEGNNWIIQLKLDGKRGVRTIKCPPSVRDVLDRWRSVTRFNRPEDYIFTTNMGKPYKGTPDDAFRRLLKKLDIKGKTLYSTRHTYISNKLRHGKPVPQLAKHCGTGPEQIHKAYSHLTSLESSEDIVDDND